MPSLAPGHPQLSLDPASGLHRDKTHQTHGTHSLTEDMQTHILEKDVITTQAGRGAGLERGPEGPAGRRTSQGGLQRERRPACHGAT